MAASWRNTCIAGLVAVLALAGRAGSTPTALNIAPTADVMDRETYNIQLETHARPGSYDDRAQCHLLTQFGAATGLEIGIDLTEADGDPQWCMDAKWQFLRETEKRPAAAVGALDLSHGVGSSWYLAASKDVLCGRARLTGGLLNDDSSHALLGIEYRRSHTTGIQLDWITGGDGQVALGMTQRVTPALGYLLYYARDTRRSGEGFVGLNLCWEGAWR
jgi:hypothetical protein